MTTFSGDQMLYRYGDTQPVFIAPASASVINIGDNCFIDPDTHEPKSAGDMLDQGSLTLNQDAFQMYYLGVAEQASPAGETAEIRFATGGVFEFDCASATFNLGDLVGLCETSAGTALEPKKVVAVALPSLAIGRVVKKYATATTKVLVRVVSTIMNSGIQAQAVGSSSGAV